MQIMTKAGYRPLYDPSPVWVARHQRLANARDGLDRALAVPMTRNEEELRTRHNNIMAAYRVLDRAQDAMIGG